MSERTEPRTEAGKRLVGSLVPVLIPDDRRGFFEMCIRDIEDEERAALAAKVRALTTYNAFAAVNEAGDRETIPMIEVSAVLALLEEPR